MPVMIATGRKTPRLVAVPATTESEISTVPSSAAVSGEYPRSRYLKMFSIIRIALLTSTPIEMASPRELMMFME